MNQQKLPRPQEETGLEAFAAELTQTAYPIALKYGVRGSSLDLELEIWKAVSELVRKRGRDLLCAPATGSVVGARLS
jgi:hypothetical protein